MASLLQKLNTFQYWNKFPAWYQLCNAFTFTETEYISVFKKNWLLKMSYGINSITYTETEYISVLQQISYSMWDIECHPSFLRGTMIWKLFTFLFNLLINYFTFAFNSIYTITPILLAGFVKFPIKYWTEVLDWVNSRIIFQKLFSEARSMWWSIVVHERPFHPESTRLAFIPMKGSLL